MSISAHVEALTKSESARADVLLPIRAADLVTDESIGGFGVGDAQQRLGEAHQHHAFLGREPVFVQEGVEPALADPLLTHTADEVACAFGNAVERIGWQRRRLDQLLHNSGFVRAGGGAHRVPQLIGRRRRLFEDHHGPVMYAETASGSRRRRLLASNPPPNPPPQRGRETFLPASSYWMRSQLTMDARTSGWRRSQLMKDACASGYGQARKASSS